MFQMQTISTSEKPLKLTCIGDGTKRNAYILPSNYYYELRNSVVSYLFGSGEAIKHDFRVYWIDEDKDEIDIVNQSDYEIFLKSNPSRLHLYAVTKADTAETQQQEKKTIDGMFPTKAVHANVECDVCLQKPIIGFRYKCIECHNFDLCQNCEAKHCHADHMMVRMPNADCPNVIEAWVTGRVKRNHKRHSRNCAPPDLECINQTGGGDTERHHRRSHRRREQLNHGIFGHLYKMMVDFAEGDSPVDELAKKTEESRKAAEDVGAKPAAGVNTENVGSTEKVETKKEQTTTGAIPKTPPTARKADETAGNAMPPTEDPGLNSIPITPSLENLAQLIDPQYMRTGIEILNNFSEMFAKMLDPNEGVGMTCPFETVSNNTTRKNSTTSTNSSASKGTSTTNVEKQVTTEQEVANEKPTSTTVEMTDAAKSSSVTEQRATPEREHSQSLEENGWQVIEKQATTNEVTNNLSPTTAAPAIDFAQLSKDLKAHIEEEQKRQDETQQPQIAAATQTNNAATISTATTTNETPIATAPMQQPNTQTAPQPTPPTNTNEEKRGMLYYHPDPRINNAVHAMMAMGFSNEGAWLTQLLESVNGNIPEALDLMSAAQRNRR